MRKACGMQSLPTICVQFPLSYSYKLIAGLLQHAQLKGCMMRKACGMQSLPTICVQFPLSYSYKLIAGLLQHAQLKGCMMPTGGDQLHQLAMSKTGRLALGRQDLLLL